MPVEAHLRHVVHLLRDRLLQVRAVFQHERDDCIERPTYRVACAKVWDCFGEGVTGVGKDRRRNAVVSPRRTASSVRLATKNGGREERIALFALSLTACELLHRDS